MPFSAINTYEQELKQRNERHTSELQSEQAMAVYQKALEAQTAGDFSTALDGYQKLFEFDVSQPKKLAASYEAHGDITSDISKLSESKTASEVAKDQLGPAIRIRAMALKNFASLLSNQNDISNAMANEALAYSGEASYLIGTDDPDKLVLPSMAQVFWASGFRRLARLTLEILVQSERSSALEPLKLWKQNRIQAHRLFGPRMLQFLESLDYIEAADKSAPLPAFLTHYSNLRELGEEQPDLSEFLESESTVVVSLAARSWHSLITSLNDASNAASKRSKRKVIRDSYVWSYKDMWDVQFEGISFNRQGTVELPTAEQAAETSEEPKAKDDATLEDTNTHDREPHDYKTEGPHTPPDQSSMMIIDEPEKLDANVQEAKENDEIEDDHSEDTSTIDQSANTAHEEETQNQDRRHSDGGNEDHDSDTSPRISVSETSNAAKSNAKPVIPISPVVASPAKRRRTERVKRSSLALPADFGVTDAQFAAQFNAYLVLANNDKTVHTTFYSPASLFLDTNQKPSSELAGAAESRDLLTGWDSRESKILSMEAASARPQKGGIMTTLQKGNVNGSDSSVNDGNDEEETEDPVEEALNVDNFVSSHEHMHIQQVRWSLASNLLARLSCGGHSRRFGEIVFNFVDELESLSYERRNFMAAPLRTALFGLYADRWIQKHDDQSELKLHRWKLISSLSPSLTHSWITAFVDQEREHASPESSISQFNDIVKNLEPKDENPHLFSHLKEIPPSSIANAQMQISKFKAASAFERVLTPSTDSNSKTTTNEEDIELLEAMLMPENHAKPSLTSDSEFEAIQNFLSYSQPQFKMGLWYLLLEKYEARGSTSDSLTGLTKIFMEAQAAFAKGEPLLSTLSVAHDVGKRSVGLLQRSPGLLLTNLKAEQAQEISEEVLKLLQILHLFLLYDEAVNSNLMQKPVTPTWVKAANKSRELVVIWWTLFYKFWLCCVDPNILKTPEVANDILSIIHERLGHLGYCGLADGCLLTLHIFEISRMDWDGSALDICQCLKCKFGLNSTLYGDIANHHTVLTPLTKNEAELVLPFVMRSLLRHRSYNQIVMRMDIRHVVHELASVLDIKDAPRHQSRVTFLKSFLAQDITFEILRQSWHGIQDGKLAFPDDEDGQGVWTTQAHVLLTQYKMRRRQSYGALSVKTESLEGAISLYIDDIAARPRRFESWVGLATAFSYLTEDCLTFGDEAAVPNKPDQYCRQALLAASQAIALRVGSERGTTKLSIAQTEIADNLGSTIWSLVGHLLYIAVMPPLICSPFSSETRPSRPLLVNLGDPSSFRLGTRKPRIVDSRSALTLVIRCLSKPTDQQQDWINAMYQTQSALELGYPAAQAIKYAKRAYELCPTSAQDPKVELLNVVWHYHHSHKLSDDDARKVLTDILPEQGKDAKNGKDISERDEKVDVTTMLEWRLRKLADGDKWLHKPRYLLSQILLSDRKDTKAAQDELLHLFSLKSPTKPLVIWNTDNDLPGEHRVAMTRYVRSSAELMFVNKDSKGSSSMVRRFRRAGFEMWNHSQTCDYIHSKACQLVRMQIELTPNKSKYGESLISQISNDGSIQFNVATKAMSDPTSGFRESDPWVQALFYVLELRKNHTGLSALAMADELVITIFLTMFKKFAEANPTKVTATPTPAVNTPDTATANSTPASAENEKASATKKEKVRHKKIMRKDVVVAAQQFSRQFQAAFSKIDNASFPENFGKLEATTN